MRTRRWRDAAIELFHTASEKVRTNSMTAIADPAFWRGRRVLLTGHTGFKGTWAALWLSRAGAHVTGLALPPSDDPAFFDLVKAGSAVDHRIADLREPAAVTKVVREARPEIVLHMAAQSLVRRAFREPVQTIATNTLGTVHLLDAIRSAEGLRAVLVVTTDKVY
jgi:CDP-glucose 4,6-dehydratase